VSHVVRLFTYLILGTVVLAGCIVVPFGVPYGGGYRHGGHGGGHGYGHQGHYPGHVPRGHYRR
jgi:hypothetical protein